MRDYLLTDGAPSQLRAAASSPTFTAALSHRVRRRQRPDFLVEISGEFIEEVRSSPSLPNPVEQADNIIRYLAERTHPGQIAEFGTPSLTVEVGSFDDTALMLVVNELKSSGLPKCPYMGMGTLTFAGWERFEKIRRTEVTSRTGFMAMKFSNKDLKKIFIQYLKPPSAAAGFDLRRLDENSPAGSIDARLQNEIRSARFLVADLSDQNVGAYWEAGFALGLNKPVIYMCEAAVFENMGTHFDTRQFHTIPWKADRGAEVGEELKQTIRATLPLEARMTDE